MARWDVTRPNAVDTCAGPAATGTPALVVRRPPQRVIPDAIAMFRTWKPGGDDAF